MAAISLSEAIHSQRAIRYYLEKPIPDSAIEHILHAAIRAPSGGNSQGWAFIVVRNPTIKQSLATLYREFWDNDYSKRADRTNTPVYQSAKHLVETFGEAPVIIIPCIKGTKDSTSDRLTTGASIYPAVQNLMLAALGLGIGSVITTFLQHHENKVKQLLHIPDGYLTACAVPLGYPSGEETFGGSKRRPLSAVVHYERW